MTVKEILASIERLDAAARHAVVPTLQRAEPLLVSARDELGEFDDAAARKSRALTEGALDDVRQVAYGIMGDFERFARELAIALAD